MHCRFYKILVAFATVFSGFGSVFPVGVPFIGQTGVFCSSARYACSRRRRCAAAGPFGPVRCSRPLLSGVPFFGSDQGQRGVCACCLVGGSEDGKALASGPYRVLLPGAGDSRRVGSALCQQAPAGSTVDSGRPGGAAFLQHDLYTASDLAVIVPPAALAARSGSRGSLCMGTPTSPYAALHRLPTGSVPGTVATPGVMCHTPAAALRGPAAK